MRRQTRGVVRANAIWWMCGLVVVSVATPGQSNAQEAQYLAEALKLASDLREQDRDDVYRRAAVIMADRGEHGRTAELIAAIMDHSIRDHARELVVERLASTRRYEVAADFVNAHFPHERQPQAILFVAVAALRQGDIQQVPPMVENLAGASTPDGFWVFAATNAWARGQRDAADQFMARVQHEEARQDGERRLAHVRQWMAGEAANEEPALLDPEVQRELQLQTVVHLIQAGHLEQAHTLARQLDSFDKLAVLWDIAVACHQRELNERVHAILAEVDRTGPDPQVDTLKWAVLARLHHLLGHHEVSQQLADRVVSRADEDGFVYLAGMLDILLRSREPHEILELGVLSTQTLGQAMIEAGRVDHFHEWIATLGAHDKAVALLGAAGAETAATAGADQQ